MTHNGTHAAHTIRQVADRLAQLADADDLQHKDPEYVRDEITQAVTDLDDTRVTIAQAARHAHMLRRLGDPHVRGTAATIVRLLADHNDNPEQPD